ncbi:MAG: hypothetical protein K0U45_06425 [Alphaproteobacteria bacterium]|nr:hypothetical protein [Alphaproteobacteria bacterium]
MEQKPQKKPQKKSLKIGLDYQLKLQKLPLGAHDYIYHGNEAECYAIAQRLELSKINQLKGAIELIRKSSKEFILNGAVHVDYQQYSVLTYDEIRAQFNFDFTIALLYQPPKAKNHKEIVLDLNEAEIFDTEILPLTDYLVQELSLNLPLSPEHAENSQIVAQNITSKI